MLHVQMFFYVLLHQEEIESIFLFSYDTTMIHIAVLAAFKVSLANLVALPCRLFYGVSLRISFKSEVDFMHSKYISARRLPRKR